MNRKEHMKADLLLLGYTNETVHAFMDFSVKWLGAGHRLVYHNINAIRYLRALFGKRAGRIALLHLLIDGNIIDRKFIEKLIKKIKLKDHHYN